MNVYIFLYNGCTSESAAMTISVHMTKVGAWRAKRRFMLEIAADEREFALRHGGRRMMRDKPLAGKWFGIAEMELLP